MKYEKMSDYEINRAVAAYHIPCSYEPYEELGYVRRISLGSDCEVIVGDIFDPCNSPSDAWPIIFENKISMNSFYGVDGWAWKCRTIHTPPISSENPLRAAMIVYLMMKDAENE